MQMEKSLYQNIWWFKITTVLLTILLLAMMIIIYRLQNTINQVDGQNYELAKLYEEVLTEKIELKKYYESVNYEWMVAEKIMGASCEYGHEWHQIEMREK